MAAPARVTVRCVDNSGGCGQPAVRHADQVDAAVDFEALDEPDDGLVVDEPDVEPDVEVLEDLASDLAAAGVELDPESDPEPDDPEEDPESDEPESDEPDEALEPSPPAGLLSPPVFPLRASLR